MSSHISHAGIIVKKFAGSPDQRVEDFLISYNFYAKVHKRDDQTKCEGVREFLEDKARLWFNNLLRQRDYRPESVEEKREEDDKAVAKVKELFGSWSLMEAAITK